MTDNNYDTLQDKHPLRTINEQKVWDLIAGVNDPEVPVLSVVDLGIVRKVECSNATGNSLGQQLVTITITPTYSGCPAMDVIAMTIRFTLLQAGYKNIEIKTVLSPAWTTDWMSYAGKQKLKAYGIAPPNSAASINDPSPFSQQQPVQCPRCNSLNTQQVSQFGSTACKALYQCQDCQEPFDYFKCH